jgi:hypothetical protein
MGTADDGDCGDIVLEDIVSPEISDEEEAG